MDPLRIRPIVTGTLILGGMISVGLAAGWTARRLAAPPEVSADTTGATHSGPYAGAPTARLIVPDACGTVGFVAPGRTTSGGAIALSPAQDLIAVADADRNVVEILSVTNAGITRLRSVPTGASPAQAVFSSDGRVFVTERGANRVSVYRAATGERLCSANVASEPVGIAIAPDERSILVTSGLGQTLTALDTSTFAERFHVDPGRAPRGVVITPDGRHAFVSHVAGEPLTAFDLNDTVPIAHALPPMPIPSESAPSLQFARQAFMGEGLGAGSIGIAAPTGPAAPLPSQAHAVVFDPQTQQVLVPLMVNRTGREVPAVARQDVYGAGSIDPTGNEKVSFAMAIFDVAHDRWAGVRMVQPSAAVPVAGIFARTGIGSPPSTATTLRPGTVRIPSAATLSPDGLGVDIASTGTDQIVTVPIAVAPPPPTASAVGMRSAHLRATESAAAPATAGSAVSPGSTGTTGTTGSLPAAAAPATPAIPSSEATLDAPVGLVALRDGRRVVWSLVEHAVEIRHGAETERLVLGDDPLPPDVSRGRRLFLAADDARLTSGGLACGGCHPDGADDGLVWFLQRGPRQTPTLPGRLTPPFNWNGTAWTMEENIAQTVRRLGGTGIPMTDIDAIAAYVMHGLHSPASAPHAPSDIERRGQELFATVGACAPCHDPLRNFTDGQPHELGGLGPDETERRFDTPSLRFAGATAPYFHDGRYATLEAVLRDPTHRMGHVEGLSAPDVDALAAYLRTL